MQQPRARRNGIIAIAVILGVVIIDQALKIWVKTSFYLGESLEITSWFKLCFIENNGMAFGMELGSKLFLTLFRVVAVSGLIWYICRLLQHNQNVKTGYVVCLSLITAGAAGNIFDCLFYGLIFNNPLPPEIAELFPAGGGYAALFHGKVVDMLYFPLFSFYWPQWMPWIGGEHFIFFQPVFNFADAAITCGMIATVIFYSKYISSPFPAKGETKESDDVATPEK